MWETGKRYRKIHAALPAVLAAAVLFIQLPVSAAESSALPTEEEYLAENPEEDRGIRQEKYYLLEAMDELQDIGLSPILIWSKISKNEKVLDTVNNLGHDAARAVTEAVTEKVTEAGTAAADKAGEIVQEQTEKVKQSLWERIREQIRSFFDSLFGG